MVRVCPSPISYPTAQVQLDGAVLPLPLVAYKGQALVQPTTIRQHRAHQRGQHSDHPCHNHYQYHYEGSIPITFNYHYEGNIPITSNYQYQYQYH